MRDDASDLPRPERFRLVASLRVRSTEEGGRSTPIGSGYRPNCWFGQRGDGEPMYNDCAVYLRVGGDVFAGPDDLLWVPPGGRCVADVQPMFAGLVRPFVRVGSRFTLCEGHRVVADAEVQSVLDPGPEFDLD